MVATCLPSTRCRSPRARSARGLASRSLAHPHFACSFMPGADPDLNIVTERAQAVFELGLTDIVELSSDEQRELWLGDRHARGGLALGEPQVGNAPLDELRQPGLHDIA